MSTHESSRPASGRPSPLAMDAATFRRLGHQIVDQLADALASVPGRPVTPNDPPPVVREAFGIGRPLPEQGADPVALLATLAPRLFDRSLFNAHPRFFGYVTAPPTPIGILGDFIASALNANCGSWTLAPAATEIEVETVRWIAQLIGYPADSGGLLVSGGNMANFVGFLAARTAKAPWDVRALGAAGGRSRLVAYGSTEMHTWIQKAADLFGIGTAAIHWIPTDRDQRMDLAALSRRIDEDLAAGALPFLVVGTAGSVSTGAVDPLPEIAALCRERDLWFHVDGAYGGFAAASPDAPADLAGLVEADSVAIDPHKWLYAPLEVGCALVRSADHLRQAFSYHPPYYHFAEQVTNFVDLGPQNSRGFRALKVWLALQQAGAAGYRQTIGDDMRLSRQLADAVRRTPELELITQGLSVTTFRYVPDELRATVGREATEQRLNLVNEALLDRLQRSGEAFVSNAVVDGRYVLRACIVNFHTEARDVDALPGIVVRLGRETA